MRQGCYGIVDAYKNLGEKINVPIIVRLEDTNLKKRKILLITQV